MTFVATSLTLATSLHAAHADDPSATDIAAARDLGKEGVLLANDGKCTEAVDKLQRAEKLFHAPTILGRLGECQVSLGKIVEGTENLQRVVHEPLTSSSPPAYVAAVERAQKVLALARPRIAKLTINLNVPADVSATVTIDGELVSSGLIGGARPTNPGVHTVEAIATGYRSAKAQVTLADGATSSVTLTIDTRDDGAAVKPALVPTTAPTVAAKVDGPVPVPLPRESDRSTSTGATRLPAYVALGMGGLGLVTS